MKVATLNCDDVKITPLQLAFGRRVRELRLAAGHSQEGFADLCGVHRTFMGTVERGESNISLSNIAKIAATLKLSLADLFDGVPLT